MCKAFDARRGISDIPLRYTAARRWGVGVHCGLRRGVLPPNTRRTGPPSDRTEGVPMDRDGRDAIAGATAGVAATIAMSGALAVAARAGLLQEPPPRAI